MKVLSASVIRITSYNVCYTKLLRENAPPGHFDKLGIGYRQLSEINPRLVYLWVGERGQWGPLKDQPGAMDPVGQNAMGFTHGTGAPEPFGGTPTRSGWWLADQVGGTFAAMGAMAAVITSYSIHYTKLYETRHSCAI